MCTVTYLPLPNAGFLLTSSRDEKVSRPAAIFPLSYRLDNQTVCFPKDPQSAGTWVAASSRMTVCLLNGAFQAHTSRAPYRHSRGLVVLSVFDYPSPEAWFSSYNFMGIEPFTLVIAQSDANESREVINFAPIERLWEVRWDGYKSHIRQLNPQFPQIWSSVTLYADEVIARRRQWFRDWLHRHQDQTVTLDAIREFHKRAGAGDRINALQMNRGNGMQTVSLTTIQNEGSRTILCYEDLLTNTTRHQQLSTTHEHALSC